MQGCPVESTEQWHQRSLHSPLPSEISHSLYQLLRQTYASWDAGWVTFTWRAYTYDHVQRVRRLALNLCAQEGGDLVATELAALLHDITKPYDGEIIVDGQGRRIVDERGFWRNHPRLPARHNKVTQLYDHLGLAGTLHNESGAVIAQHLLPEYGFGEDTCRLVAKAIQHHLQPPDDATTEGLCLFDADTIDANIGMPSFVRNIYIHLHLYDLRKEPGTADIAEILQIRPMAYLRPYITDQLPSWVAGKRRDFIPRLRTESGHALALRRLKRLDRLFSYLEQEVTTSGENRKRSCLQAVMHFITHTDDPSIARETAFLADGWLREAKPEAEWFINHLQAEMAGTE